MKITRYRIGSGDLISFYSEENRQNFSISDIKKILRNPIISPRFRLNLLNEDETIRNEIPPFDIITGGSYNENYQNGQRRTLSVSLFNDNKQYMSSINNLWAGTKFSFQVGIELSDSNTIWFSKGVYTLLSASPNHSPGVKTIALELGDKFAILQGKEATFDASITFPVGTSIEELIQDLLNYDRGNGTPIDPVPFIYHSSFKGKTLPNTLTKEAGSTIGDVIMELADILSAEVFYDIEGHLTWLPSTEASNDNDKPILFDFTTSSGDLDSEQFTLNFEEIVNKVVVIGGSINGKTCQATAINDNATSPLCYQRIGYRTVMINDSNITSDLLAQERADYELRQVSIMTTSTSLPTFFNPLISVNNLITVTDNYFDFQQSEFLVKGVSFSLDFKNSMTLSCSNIMNLPFILN